MVSWPPLVVPVPPQMLLSAVPLSAATSVQLVTGAALVLASVMLAQYPPPHASTVIVAFTPLLETAAALPAVVAAEPSGAPWLQAARPARASAARIEVLRVDMSALLVCDAG